MPTEPLNEFEQEKHTLERDLLKVEHGERLPKCQTLLLWVRGYVYFNGEMTDKGRQFLASRRAALTK